MTDREKVLVLTLVAALDDILLPMRLAMDRFDAIDAECQRRIDALERALAAVRAVL